MVAVVRFGGSACARGKRSNENVKDKTYVQRREKIESAKVTGFHIPQSPRKSGVIKCIDKIRGMLDMHRPIFFVVNAGVVAVVHFGGSACATGK